MSDWQDIELRTPNNLMSGPMPANGLVESVEGDRIKALAEREGVLDDPKRFLLVGPASCLWPYGRYTSPRLPWQVDGSPRLSLSMLGVGWAIVGKPACAPTSRDGRDHSVFLPKGRELAISTIRSETVRGALRGHGGTSDVCGLISSRSPIEDGSYGSVRASRFLDLMMDTFNRQYGMYGMYGRANRPGFEGATGDAGVMRNPNEDDGGLPDVSCWWLWPQEVLLVGILELLERLFCLSSVCRGCRLLASGDDVVEERPEVVKVRAMQALWDAELAACMEEMDSSFESCLRGTVGWDIEDEDQDDDSDGCEESADVQLAKRAARAVTGAGERDSYNRKREITTYAVVEARHERLSSEELLNYAVLMAPRRCT